MKPRFAIFTTNLGLPAIAAVHGERVLYCTPPFKDRETVHTASSIQSRQGSNWRWLYEGDSVEWVTPGTRYVVRGGVLHKEDANVPVS